MGFELTTAVKAPTSALILGATGQTGRQLLSELIASPTFTRVCEAGRRVTPSEELPTQASEKLEQKVIDFERLDEAGLKEGNWDVVFISYVLFARWSFGSLRMAHVDWVRPSNLQGPRRILRKLTRSACLHYIPSLTSCLVLTCAGMSPTQRKLQRQTRTRDWCTFL